MAGQAWSGVEACKTVAGQAWSGKEKSTLFIYFNFINYLLQSGFIEYLFNISQVEEEITEKVVSASRYRPNF